MKTKAILIFLCPLVFTYYLIAAFPMQAAVDSIDQDLGQGKPYLTNVNSSPAYLDPAWSGYSAGVPNFTGASSIDPPMEISSETSVSFSAILADWLDVDDLVSKATSAGATSVDLWVGYSGLVFFDIDGIPNRYGLIESSDGGQLLTDAITKFHENDIKVIAVLSSQLWGANPPLAAVPMIQDNGQSTTDLFDPQKSQNFMVQLVDKLMDYDVDGVFVGEPYYKNSTFHVNDSRRNERFYDFYQAIDGKIKERNPNVVHQMLLPVHFWLYQGYNFGAGLRDHGLADNIKDVNFDQIGVDISSIYQWQNWAQDIGRYKAMLALTNRLAAGKTPMAQISIIKYGSSSQVVPKQVVLDQITWAKRYGMGQLQVFDYMYFDLYSGPDRTEILNALKNINVDTSVSSEPRAVKLLSTRDALWASDWHGYISNQVNAAAQMSSISMIKIALDEDVSARPIGSVSIDSGEHMADSTRVLLSMRAAGGGGSRITGMRFKNAGGRWSSWYSYASRKTWYLTSPEGTKRVYAQFRDSQGLISDAVQDSIWLQTIKPIVSLTAPWVSTKYSRTTTFKIRWSASHPPPVSSFRFTVRYRAASERTWTTLKVTDSAGATNFRGTPGRTYYFRVKAENGAGHIGWSPVRKTIVPYDQSQLIFKQAGFGHKFFARGSGYFLGTTWYSVRRRNRIVYKFDGQSVSLIAARGPTRSKAKIYIDGRYVKTIDNYAARTQVRQVVFHRAWRRRGTHYLKVVNLATPGRRRFDIDGLAVERPM